MVSSRVVFEFYLDAKVEQFYFKVRFLVPFQNAKKGGYQCPVHERNNLTQNSVGGLKNSHPATWLFPWFRFLVLSQNVEKWVDATA